MMPLTKRQAEVLAYVRQFIADHGYAPGLSEMGAALGLSSLATIHKHVENLERKGYIKRQWNRSRTIEVLAPEPTLTNRIASAFTAGFESALRGDLVVDALEKYTTANDRKSDEDTQKYSGIAE